MPAVRPGVRGAVITGWGTALPTEGAHERRPRTDDGHERRSGSSSGPASANATSAAPPPTCRSSRRDRRSPWPGSNRSEIDGLILATTTPDRMVPATASTVQHELGLSCGAFDVNAACSGWVYALINAHGMIAMGADKVLVDRHRHARPHRRLDRPQHGDPVRRRLGRGRDRSGRRARADARLGPRFRRQRRAVPVLRASTPRCRWTARRSSGGRSGRWSTPPTKSMAHAGVTADDIALVVPHQANTRIISAAIDRLGCRAGAHGHRARPHRQHVVGVGAAGARRRARRRPRQATATSSCSSASAPG